jgi:hypothetical protein
MKHVSYLGYVITVTANNEKNGWRSHVSITWYAGKFDLHDEVCFLTETEAEEQRHGIGKALGEQSPSVNARVRTKSKPSQDELIRHSIKNFECSADRTSCRNPNPTKLMEQ